MSHIDPEQLALAALGEPTVSAEEREHLATCRRCADELAQMVRVTAVARAGLDAPELHAPPDDVWERIREELTLGTAASAPASAQQGESASADAPVDTPRRRGRSRRTMWLLAASVALVASIAGAVVWSTSLAPTDIATATLEAFPGHPGDGGAAQVQERRDGSRTLTVSISPEHDTGGYREVWLIRADGQALISLGVLSGSTSQFPIPDGVDLAEYDLVDISLEPIDGNPTHSGDSLARGQLVFI